MTNTNDEETTLRKLKARHADLDLDIKLLRLRLKAGFDPSQPRVPAGDPDGGQWTDSGGGAGRARTGRNPTGLRTSPTKTPARSATASPSGKPGADQARVATRVGPRDSPERPHVQHTVSLAGGRRFVFQTEGRTQTVLDGAGNPISKAVWTPNGPTPFRSSSVRVHGTREKPSTRGDSFTTTFQLATRATRGRALPLRPRNFDRADRYCKA